MFAEASVCLVVDRHRGPIAVVVVDVVRHGHRRRRRELVLARGSPRVDDKSLSRILGNLGTQGLECFCLMPKQRAQVEVCRFQKCDSGCPLRCGRDAWRKLTLLGSRELPTELHRP